MVSKEGFRHDRDEKNTWISGLDESDDKDILGENSRCHNLYGVVLLCGGSAAERGCMV